VGPLREKLRKMSEDEPQVYSIKKTCGSEFEDMRKAAQSVPLQQAWEGARSLDENLRELREM